MMLIYFLISILIICSIWFVYLDVKSRSVPNKYLIFATILAIPFIILTYSNIYFVQYGVILSIFFGIFGCIIPFVWYFVMPNWIGEADCKWLMVVFVALPFMIIQIIIILIIFTLLTWCVMKILKIKEVIPEMIPILCSLICCFVFVLFFGQ